MTNFEFTTTSASGLDFVDMHHFWGTPEYTDCTPKD